MSDLDADIDAARIRLRSAYLAIRAAHAERDVAETSLYELWLSSRGGSKSYLSGRYRDDRSAILAEVEQVIL